MLNLLSPPQKERDGAAQEKGESGKGELFPSQSENIKGTHQQVEGSRLSSPPSGISQVYLAGKDLGGSVAPLTVPNLESYSQRFPQKRNTSQFKICSFQQCANCDGAF